MIGALTDGAFRFGSYRREDLAGTLLQKKLWDRGIFLAKSGEKLTFFDDIADALLRRGAISDAQHRAYYREAYAFLRDRVDLTVGTNEDILRAFSRLRMETLGRDVLRRMWERKDAAPHAVAYLDQTELLSAYEMRKTVFYYLSDPAFLPDFRLDLQKAAAEGKRALLLLSDAALTPADGDTLLEGVAPILFLSDDFGCADFSRVDLPDEWAASVLSGDAVLRGYGEDALLAAHDLALPALVTVLPRGLMARAQAGLFSRPAVSRVFIPAHFSIRPFVPLTRRTRASYYHFARLSARYGESVYRLSFEKLAKLDPSLILNPYEDHLPPLPAPCFSFDDTSPGAAREDYFCSTLSGDPRAKYLHACLSLTDFSALRPDWESDTAREQVLIDGVLAAPGAKVSVIPLEKAESPRTLFYFDRGRRAFLSNFTFFFTEKLLTSYNARLQDCPRERIDFSVGCIDYYRYTDSSGRRRETLPLYRKTVLCKGKDAFFAFDWSLGGGSVTFAPDFTFSWSACQVNASHPLLSVYTPFFSQKDIDADDNAYLCPVGGDRLNLVTVGERVLCARRGEVFLPSIGVVFSFAGDAAKRLEALLGKPDENGYFDTSALPAPVFRPDPPEAFSLHDWENLDWAWGGGLGLMEEGGEATKGSIAARLRRAGWLSPLSRQTQESAVHTFARHPRTAVGVTGKGELVVLVFSGRTPVSAGADYVEMCRAAKKLVPDLSSFINWDGGGSSVLGYLDNGAFCEISLPAPSDGSVTGQARPVPSLLMIEIQD